MASRHAVANPRFLHDVREYVSGNRPKCTWRAVGEAPRNRDDVADRDPRGRAPLASVRPADEPVVAFLDYKQRNNGAQRHSGPGKANKKKPNGTQTGTRASAQFLLSFLV